MRGSPGLCASIQPLILANLYAGVGYGDKESWIKAVPLVLLADVVLLAKIDEVSDRLGGQ